MHVHSGIGRFDDNPDLTMENLHDYSINIGGKLMDLSEPKVMGILNVTPDSFYGASRMVSDDEIAARTAQILDEGASIIDIGAYSSRSGAADVPEEEEMRRLRRGLSIIRRIDPDAVVSVDTFRADVARMCVEEFGVAIINDISAGELDPEMFRTVALLGVPYIMMHMRGTPQNMQDAPTYGNLMKDMLMYFADRIQRMRDMGQKDIIVDPGFGFGKTLEHNYELMNNLEKLNVLELPILVGISRKSMIYRLLSTSADDALNGTSILNTIALMKGASILRVHDVKECVECVKIVEAMKKS